MSLKKVDREIMKDCGNWIFDVDEIKQILNKDIDAINKFFNDNLKIIKAMASKYVYQQKIVNKAFIYDVDDLVQQIYVDLPFYQYDTRTHFYFCIRKSFKLLPFGGYTASEKNIEIEKSIFSYDAEIVGENSDISTTERLDYLSSSDDFVEQLLDEDDREKKDKMICQYLEKTIKNKRDLNAMFCKLFTDLPASEIKGDEYEYYKQCANKNIK